MPRGVFATAATAGLLLLDSLVQARHFRGRVDDQCSTSPADRVDCGATVGANQQSCENGGCCWNPVQPNPHNYPWCFHKQGSTPSPAVSPAPAVPPAPAVSPAPSVSPSPSSPAPSGPYDTTGKAFVHLFEWSWSDVAEECEQYLGPSGFDAVQISPPMEHITGDQWWTRYQPVSYDLVSRSGNQDEMQDMITRCKKAGVEIYADSVINHMAAGSGTGINGHSFGGRSFPGLYTQDDFHHDDNDKSSNCVIDNYADQHNVQYCDLDGLPDLCTGCDDVQQILGAYLKKMAGMGVSGFRIDAAKHQEADQLGGAIAKSGISDSHFFFHEVIEGANEAVTPDMYFTLGQVTEFDFGQTVGQAFKNQDLSQLSNLASNLFESDKAVVFIDNHDTQRGNAPLTYKDKQPYILATVFMLGHPYGHPKVMSSYEFSTHDQGPPSSPVHSGSNLNCGQGQWVCEHRNPLIAPMMGFRKATGTDAVGNFVTGQSNAAAAFSRGKSGFLAVNLANNDWSSTFNSDLVRALCFVCARDSRPTMVVIVSDYVCLGVGCWIIQRYILRKQSNSKR